VHVFAAPPPPLQHYPTQGQLTPPLWLRRAHTQPLQLRARGRAAARDTMGVETRLRYAVSCRASALPRELWQLIMSFLSPAQALGAALVCSDFAAAAMPAAAAACRRLWPQHALRLASFGPGGVQRFLKLVAGHEAEAAAHPDVEKATTVQKLVCPEHRQIAVEWLIEVRRPWGTWTQDEPRRRPSPLPCALELTFEPGASSYWGAMGSRGWPAAARGGVAGGLQFVERRRCACIDSKCSC
jgi:hypothetical protein